MIEIVADDQDRKVTLPAKRLDELLDTRGLGNAEGGRGFVHQYKFLRPRQVPHGGLG